MDIKSMIRNLTQDFVYAGVHHTQHAYEITNLPTIGTLCHCKPPSKERAHFGIALDGETADLKAQIINYRQDIANPDNLIVYGILTSVKNANELNADTSLFRRNTPIEIYCDHAMTVGVLKFSSSEPAFSEPVAALS